MFELGGYPTIDENTTKRELLNNFTTYLISEGHRNIYLPKYSILYNCTSSNRYKHLKRIGFKHIGTYKTMSCQCPVKVLLLNLSERPSLFNRIFNIE